MVMIRALSCLLVLGAAHALQLGGTPTGPRSQGAAAVSEISEVPVSLDILSEIQRTVAGQPAVVFSKSSCEESLECKRLFDAIAQPYVACEIDQRSDGEEVEAALLSLTQGRALPNVFVRGQLLGGSAEMQEAAATGLLEELLRAREVRARQPRGHVAGRRGLEGVSVKGKNLREKTNRLFTTWKPDPLPRGSRFTGVKPHIKAYEAAKDCVYGSPCSRLSPFA